MKISGKVCGESGMLQLGGILAKCITAGDLVFLNGDLGAGKTTLSRGFLRALGYAGTVNSPTYAMVETYQLESLLCHHFDGYRIKSADEWLDMGLDDYLAPEAVCLIEWPDSGESILPKPTWVIDISILAASDSRYVSITTTKDVTINKEKLQACFA